MQNGNKRRYNISTKSSTSVQKYFENVYNKVGAVVRFVHNLSKRTGINHKDQKCFIVIFFFD